MQAIETRYKGYRFRSRLEARWAVFFDALGIKWDYEHEGYTEENGIAYLPDFYLPEGELYAEVKPNDFSDGDLDKCLILPRPCLLLSGTPDLTAYRMLFGRIADCEDAWRNKYSVGWFFFLKDYGYYNVIWWDEGLYSPSLNEQVVFHKMTDDFLGSYELNDLNYAISAARSARFEFGESG